MDSEPSEGHEKDKADDGTNNMPSIPSDTPPIADIPARNTENETANQTDWQRRHYRMQFAVFIVGIIVMFIYAGQLYEMRKSTDAATKAAQAAQDSADSASEFARLDERAWIALVGISGTPELNKSLEVTVDFRNTGKTYAREVALKTVIQRVGRNETPDFSLIEKESDTEGSVSLLAPSAAYQGVGKAKGDTNPITQSDLEKLMLGEFRVFIFGRIDYNDIFDCPHWLHFCVIYEPITKTLPYYRKYNEADSNRCP